MCEDIVRLTLVLHEYLLFPFRGDHFRTAFPELGHIRSSLPNVPVIAATATATKTTFQAVVKSLLMENVVVIGISPCRDNIFLTVTSVSFSEFSNNVYTQLRMQGLNYPKTVIFCRSYSDCNLVYDKLELFLGPYITFPPGKPIVRQYRLLHLYTRASTDDVKKKVLDEFVKESSQIRIIIATCAFGMGIDCPDIRSLGITFYFGGICSGSRQSWTRSITK